MLVKTISIRPEFEASFRTSSMIAGLVGLAGVAGPAERPCRPDLLWNRRLASFSLTCKLTTTTGFGQKATLDDDERMEPGTVNVSEAA
jgi:hypothetical protein